MKKIKAKIINEYNRYLISFRNSIIKKLRSLRSALLKEFSRFSLFTLREFSRFSLFTLREFSRFSSLTRKIFLYFVRLKFMKSKKIRISLLSRYLILFIILLFSCLFYFSVPVLYNYVELQKDLTKILKEEFKLNAALSGNINYKILPSPNFEILDAVLSTDSDKKFNKFAQIKKMKIYISIPELYNQKDLKINKVVLLESNFDINEKSFSYIKKFLNNQNSANKIEIKKSKLFFRDKTKNKDAIALSSISRSKIFYDKKNNSNKTNVKGSIFNTKFNLNFLKNFENPNKTFIEMNLETINTKIKNEIFKENKDNNYNGKILITFLGSEIKIDYEAIDNIIFLSSNRSTINRKKFDFNGKINKFPFYFDINIDLDAVDGIKLIKNFFELRNLLRKNILLNEKFNGKILINIDSLKSMRLFDQAKINFHFFNGDFFLKDTFFSADKIGKLKFIDAELLELDNQQLIKAKILFEIYDQKKFYQKFQIPKNNRIKIRNAYFEIEKNINTGSVKIDKFLLNSNIKNHPSYKIQDLTDLIHSSEIEKLKNWIEVKKFSNQIFSKIN